MASGRSREPSYALADTDVPAPFAQVVCAIDPSAESLEAVRQGATLAGGGGRIVLVPVDTDGGDETESERAVAAGLAAAGELGAAPTAHIPNGAGPIEVLLELAGRDDLVVSRSHRAATTLLERSEAAVLIARPAPTARPFPREILVASDGSYDSAEAVRLAGAVARRHYGLVIHLQTCKDVPAEKAALRETTRTRPVFLREDGPADEAIVATARERHCSLVVLGRRGAGRVVDDAPCSVLVARWLKPPS